MVADGHAGAAEEKRKALRDAVAASLYAPSILNSQPWRWRLRGSSLAIQRDDDRKLPSIDPTGRLAIVSCGVALHHATTTLRAHGYTVTVHRTAAADADTLAEVTVDAAEDVARRDAEMARAIRFRHSDRRPIVAAERLRDADVDALRTAAAGYECVLHRVREAHRPALGDAVERAQRAEESDENYRRELASWTLDRPEGAGVSFEGLVAPVPRPVAVRDFAEGTETGLFPGFGDDRFADYLILATAGDESVDWLRAGQALSAVWLTATARDLAMSVMSDVVEVPASRALVAGLLDGDDYPQLVLRAGYQGQPVPPPVTTRRALADVLDDDQDT
jgi:hypothetical protein